MHRILMIAFHFPPFSGSSGIFRTLKFLTYLRDFGWEPTLLTPHPRAYPSTSNNLLCEIPPDTVVRSAPAFDAARHFALRGYYPRCLALPDRWSSWYVGAIPTGLALIKKYQPHVIWSTFPIATAHLIGLTLSRISKIPWVADFRDPMTDLNYPRDVLTRRIHSRIERRALERCTKAVFTSPGAIGEQMRKYPHIPEQRYALIENGYDEENFTQASAQAPVTPRNGGALVLLHSGTLYPSERDPRLFFAALKELSMQGKISATEVHVVLRSTGHDVYLRGLIEQAGIANLVSLKPALPYREALAEMMHADALLILQAANCNYQVPAKLYEYFRAGRPILALTDPAGDTASLLHQAGVDTIAPLDSKEAIAMALLRMVKLLRAGQAPVVGKGRVALCSRKARTQELSDLLNGIKCQPC
jgi:glycosyltransferase involved in cell wall biosynthesis